MGRTTLTQRPLSTPCSNCTAPPVGRGNLGYQTQAGAVGGSPVRLQLAVSIYRPRPRRCAALHEQDKVLSFTPCAQPDDAA